MPVLGGIATPCHLHVHHIPNGDHRSNLGVNLGVVLEGLHGEADSFIADGTHDHVPPGIRNGGNWDLQDNLGGVGHELAELTVALAPFQGALLASRK